MNHNEIKYELPEDCQSRFVGESPAAMKQYADDLRYGMEVLSKVSPEDLHHIVVYLSDYAEEKSQESLREEPNDITKAAIFEAQHLMSDKVAIQHVDTESVEAMLSSCGV